MGRNARPSVLKHERERKKSEKAARKRERREQRRNEAAGPDVVSLEQGEGGTGETAVAPDAPEQGASP